MTVTALLAALAVGVPMVVGVAVEASSADRDDAFVIDAFDREVEVLPDGVLEVVETIDVTFTEPRRGIFRDLEPDGPAGEAFYRVDDVDDGAGTSWTWNYESSPAGGPRIRVGDPSVTLEPGPQRYRFTYGIAELLLHPEARPDRVQVRLDVPGDAWPTDVATTTLTVQLPAEALDVQCVVGTAGATDECPAATVEGTTVTQALPALAPATTGTVAIELPADAFTATLPTVEVEELTVRGAGTSPLDLPTVPAIALMVGLVAAPAALLEWLRSRVVYRDEVTDPALHDRVTPTAELAPPDGLAPAELAAVDRVGGFLSSGSSDMLLGTLVDLQIRGVLDGHHDEDGERVTFAPGPDADAVRPWEGAALAKLLPGGGPVTYGDEYDKTISSQTQGATRELTSHAERLFAGGSRYVHEGGRWLRGGGYVAGVIGSVLLGALIGVLAIVVAGVPIGAVLVAWGLLGAFWIALALLWREERRPLTSEGRDVIARTRAFERYLQEVHADQLEYAGSRDDIDVLHPAVALLPYAVVLGLGRSWLERFEPVLVAAAAAGQAGAVRSSDTWFLHPVGLTSVSTLQRSTVTAPSSSGSGGGSFGGGGAGSGGGGGGGGSW